MPDKAKLAEVDKELQNWQQGDVFLGNDLSFVHIADFQNPITADSRVAAKVDQSGAESALGTVALDFPGFVVLTQTCDIVRPCSDRPYVQLVPLVQVSRETISLIEQSLIPRYGYVPAVADRNLVANLDLHLTVEKAVLMGVSNHIRGCRSDTEVRKFADAISRKLTRTAFPDDFVAAFEPVRKRIVEKHGKDTRDKKGKPTNEGGFLESIREIRVVCAPSWDAVDPELTVYFIVSERNRLPKDADAIADAIVGRFRQNTRFTDVNVRLVTLNEMSAAVYLSSDSLDLERVSRSSDDDGTS